MATFTVRPARTSDVPLIQVLVEPLAQRRILLGKDRVVLYEAVQEFRIAENSAGGVVGCGALHVMWEDLGEVRTLAVAQQWLGTGAGHAILESIEKHAAELGLSRLFCLTFETAFFGGDFKLWTSGEGSGQPFLFLLLLPISALGVFTAWTAIDAAIGYRPWLRSQSDIVAGSVEFVRWAALIGVSLALSWLLAGLLTAAGLDARGGIVDT